MKLLVAAVAVGVALPAAAQSSRDTVVGEMLTRFRPGQPVQVGLLRSRWTGRYERVGGDTLFIASRGQLPMAIRFNAIDTLWRQGDHFKRGAWIGGTTLGLLGGLSMTALDIRAEFPGAELALGAGLGLIGVLTGGWIGSAFKRWVVVYP
jgi:hypothetical protein